VQSREQSANVVDFQDHEKPANCEAATAVLAIDLERMEIAGPGRPRSECGEMWKRWE
jgi:hypothetical protein